MTHQLYSKNLHRSFLRLSIGKQSIKHRTICVHNYALTMWLPVLKISFVYNITWVFHYASSAWNTITEISNVHVSVCVCYFTIAIRYSIFCLASEYITILTHNCMWWWLVFVTYSQVLRILSYCNKLSIFEISFYNFSIFLFKFTLPLWLSIHKSSFIYLTVSVDHHSLAIRHSI